MSVSFDIFMEHNYRYREEAPRVHEDWHALYASAKMQRVVQDSIPKEWIFNLKDAEGNAMGTTASTVVFRMKAIVTKNDVTQVPKVITRTLTRVADGQFKLVFQSGDFGEPNMYLGEIQLTDTTHGTLISPKKLRVEVIRKSTV